MLPRTYYYVYIYTYITYITNTGQSQVGAAPCLGQGDS